jgi:glycosyltransferase involved in cell wall biosynthesis
MRALVLCERLDVEGGVERFVCQLADLLVGEGFDVAVGTVATARDEVAYPLLPAVRVLAGAASLTGPAPTGRWRHWHLARAQWRTGRALARVVRTDRPDVIVVNGLVTACSLLALHRACAPRTICCDHNHFDARSRPWRLLRTRLYPRVAAVVSLTEADAPRFRALNPRTEVIYNASSMSADAPARPAELLVLAVGRLTGQKGFDLLLTAWPAVVAAVPEARLRIVGDGEDRSALVAQAAALGVGASVEWVAPTPYIERHYREAAVFVLPSRYEGMPFTLLEAQALGVPAVAFDCRTGPGEIVTAGTGVVVPPGDTDQLAQALVRLLSDPESRARMGGAALERARSTFSRATHERRWVDLVRGVATRAPARSTQGVAP